MIEPQDAVVYLSASVDAIDACLRTKAQAIDGISQQFGVAFDRIATIGDSVNDLPILLHPSVAMVGAPRNAQSRVADAIRILSHGTVLPQDGLGGFLQFYEACRKANMELVVSDRDGVLLWENDRTRLNELQYIYEHMGSPNWPILVVLTGSGVQQNDSFLQSYGLPDAYRRNPLRGSVPGLIFAENGAISIDIISRQTTFHYSSLDLTLHEFLVGLFRDEVLEAVSSDILSKYEFSWSTDSRDQTGRVYLPKKECMVTINVPTHAKDGSTFRTSEKADEFRHDVIQLMKEILRRNNVSYNAL